MFVLDTNVLSELRKNPANPAVLQWVRDYDEDPLFTTAVTVYEIKRGILDVPARDTRQSAVLDRWLDRVLERFQDRILSLDAAAALQAAEANKRTNIDLRDCMVAAIANTNHMTVVTRNQKHLARSPLGLSTRGLAPSPEGTDRTGFCWQAS